MNSSERRDSYLVQSAYCMALWNKWRCDTSVELIFKTNYVSPIENVVYITVTDCREPVSTYNSRYATIRYDTSNFFFYSSKKRLHARPNPSREPRGFFSRIH
jgi:hypothetical protein